MVRNGILGEPLAGPLVMSPQSVSVNLASPAASSCSLQVPQQDLHLSCISSHLPNMDVFGNRHLILLNCLHHIPCHLVKGLMGGNSFSLIIAVISQWWKWWREWNVICVPHQTLSTMKSTADLFNGMRRQYCFEVVRVKNMTAQTFVTLVCVFSLSLFMFQMHCEDVWHSLATSLV